MPSSKLDNLTASHMLPSLNGPRQRSSDNDAAQSLHVSSVLLPYAVTKHAIV